MEICSLSSMGFLDNNNDGDNDGGNDISDGTL